MAADTTPQDRAITALNDKFRCDNGAISLDPQELRHLTATKTTGPDLLDWQKLTLGEIVDCLAEAGLLADPAKAETLGLSHALLLNGYRGYADQVNAMARRIQELEAELAELRGRRDVTDVEPVLTARQVAVLRLVAAGRTYREAAAVLHISVATAKRRCADAAAVLGTTNVTHTVAVALRRGLLDGSSAQQEN